LYKGKQKSSHQIRGRAAFFNIRVSVMGCIAYGKIYNTKGHSVCLVLGLYDNNIFSEILQYNQPFLAQAKSVFYQNKTSILPQLNIFIKNGFISE
jgi:hypothetical protein